MRVRTVVGALAAVLLAPALGLAANPHIPGAPFDGASARPGQPAILFAAGQDHEQALRLGLVDESSTHARQASSTIHLRPLPGAVVVIDDLVRTRPASNVASYKLGILQPLHGDFVPVVLKVRLWTGSQAPATDQDPSVCAWLDLLSPLAQESDGACFGETRMQLLVARAQDADGHARVQVGPSSVQTT